jgi:flagellum-specific peptidoglycan hydrolase FlgJ
MIDPKIVAGAQAAQRKWGVWASVSLAQFGVESAWGRAMPHGSNNPFGIKALPGHPSVGAMTREVIHGHSVHVMQRFAVFANFAEAFEEHAKLLATSHYYHEAMEHAYRSADPSAERFIDGLHAYATDPNYRATLKRVAGSMNLYQYDSI